jgi:sugar-specific transcriptional regulator TrmB
MKKELIEIGLEEREADIYLQLLKAKRQTATRIAKETKINRTVVYSILEKLINKGLVAYVLINGKKHFSANNPKTIGDFLNDKAKLFKNILPGLNSIQNYEKDSVTIEVFQGVKGGIAVMKDIIRDGKDYVSFGDEGQFESFGTIADQYIRQLNEKKIGERLLTNEISKQTKFTKRTQIKCLPKTFRFPTSTTIYGDKVAIGIFEKPYSIILIKSKTLALTYRSMFEGLWGIAKKKP